MGGDAKKGGKGHKTNRPQGLDPFATAHLKRKQQNHGKGRHNNDERRPLLGRDDDAIPDALAKAARLKAKQEEENRYNKMASAQRKEELRRYPKLARFLASDQFELLVALSALAQVIAVTSYMSCDAGEKTCDDCGCSSGVKQFVQAVFYLTIPWFVVVWFCRIYVDRLEVFLKSLFLMDTACTWIFGVLFGIVVYLDKSLLWLLSMNVLRVMQMAYAVRLLHKKNLFKETWLLIRGFSSSMRTLVSSAILLLITVYLFAIIGVGTIGHTNKNVFTHEEAFLRAEGFNSLNSAIMMLFRFLFHDDSFDIVLSLSHDLPAFLIYYALFVTMTTFVVLNLITGIIVDKAVEITSLDEEMNAMKMIEERQTLMQQLADIFSLLDTDGSGSVSFEEFIQAFQISEMRYMLQALDFDEKDLIDLFQTLDDDNAGCLNLEEFLFGMSRLHGEPRAKDFLALMKLAEACADLSKYLSMKLVFDKGAGGKNAKVAGERSRDLCNRINELRQKVLTTQKVVEMMIHACKTIKSHKLSNSNNHDSSKSSTSI